MEVGVAAKFFAYYRKSQAFGCFRKFEDCREILKITALWCVDRYTDIVTSFQGHNTELPIILLSACNIDIDETRV